MCYNIGGRRFFFFFFKENKKSTGRRTGALGQCTSFLAYPTGAIGPSDVF
jgi:hypothetical protein